jgi:hypothetical protein
MDHPYNYSLLDLTSRQMFPMRSLVRQQRMQNRPTALLSRSRNNCVEHRLHNSYEYMRVTGKSRIADPRRYHVDDYVGLFEGICGGEGANGVRLDEFGECVSARFLA